MAEDNDPIITLRASTLREALADAALQGFGNAFRLAAPGPTTPEIADAILARLEAAQPTPPHDGAAQGAEAEADLGTVRLGRVVQDGFTGLYLAGYCNDCTWRSSHWTFRADGEREDVRGLEALGFLDSLRRHAAECPRRPTAAQQPQPDVRAGTAPDWEYEIDRLLWRTMRAADVRRGQEDERQRWIDDMQSEVRRRFGLAAQGAADVRAELLAFAAALGRDEVAGYALARIVPCSTDEDGHVDDWDFAPLYDTDEAPLDDAAYGPVVDAYAEWVNRPDLLAAPAGEQGR